MKPGFDNDQYIRQQSERIRERISQFGGKLYLEFGGKLFDDHHASRVLPGFQPDSKLRMLKTLSDRAEVVIAVNAQDIETNKLRGDLAAIDSRLKAAEQEATLAPLRALTRWAAYIGGAIAPGIGIAVQ